MADTHEIPAAVREGLARLAEPRPMRRGSLSERYMKCNKSGCPCAEHPQARHGPYFSFTRGVGGSTRSRLLSAGQAKVARSQIEAGRQFRKQVEDYWEACERWADTQLETVEATSQEAAKKGGSKRRSKPRSWPRSKRS